MFKKAIILGIMIGGLCGMGVAAAEELPNLFRGIRPLGMGGAFITLSDDENAMFYNPAGLNDVSGFGGVGLLNPLFEVSQNSNSLYQDLSDLDTDSEAEVADFLSKMVGEHQHARVALLPHFYMHNFAIGALGQGTLDMEIRNRANPVAETKINFDAGLLVSAAWGFFDQGVQIGATGKYIKRDGISHVYTVPEIAASNFDPIDQREKESDSAFDIGTKFNFKTPLKPSVALVVQNITDLDFKELGVIPQQVNIGAAINPDFWILKTTFAVEIDDLTKNVDSDKDLMKRTHFGAEFRFPKVFSVRAGLSGGYLSAGFGIDLWILSISGATYAEEIGAFAGQRSDRRYAVQASLGF
ncbi:MAG: hypothetical protein EPO39_18865 [Candidatus Manganitrophaceae bacterium]|nr:MAG: hypothetical protein EPO39_18865 [Candidatus Manganitrophaceae bacterium]